MALATHASPMPPTANDDTWALERVVYGPYAAAALADGTYVLGVLPFAGDVEKISLRAGTLAAANNDSVQFKVAAPGTAKGSATAITAAEPLDATNGGSGFTLVAEAFVDVPFNNPNTTTPTAQKNLAEGSLFCMTTAGTIASLADLTIHVTYRRGNYRTNDAGEKFYPYSGQQVM